MSNFDLTGTTEDGDEGAAAAKDHSLETFCWLYKEGDALLATGGADGLIRIISVANSEEIKILEGHKSKLSHLRNKCMIKVDISPNLTTTFKYLELIYDIQSHPQSDNIILSTSKDGTIRLWDIDQNKCIAIFEADATVTVCILRFRIQPTQS